MTLDDALDQISDIRSQMATTRIFRAYRCTTTLFSAFVAIATAIIQHLWIPDSAHHVEEYLELWFSAGIVSLAVVATGMTIRYRRSDSPLDRELALSAIQQFMPCLVVGGLVTYVLAGTAWQSMWIIPGLWTLLFGLGILASRQLLPAATSWVGFFYLLCGLVSISESHLHPFSAWVMGIPFGIGQTLTAAILYWKLERHRVPE